MPFSVLPEDEKAVLEDEKLRAEKSKKALQGFDPTSLGSRVSALHKMYPHISPGVALSLVKGNATEATIKAAADAEAERIRQQEQKAAREVKGWDKVFEGIKTGTRYVTAALALPYEAAVNIASQPFTGGAEGLIDGFTISTSFGSMLADGDKSGRGWFIGGDAQLKQADRARRYRGTINGQAWTIGRGAASLVFEPGSEAYRTLSGLVDLGAVLGLDPLNYAVPVAGGALNAQRGVVGIGKAAKFAPIVDDVADAAVGLRRAGEAVEAVGGLHVTARSVNPSKVRSWLDSAQGQRIVEKIAATKTLAETRKILPKLSTRRLIELTDTQSPEAVRAALDPILGIAPGLIKPSDVKYRSVFSGMPEVQETGIVKSMLRRLSPTLGDPTGKMPGQVLSLRSSDRSIDEGVESMDRWLRSMGVDETERAKEVEDFARAMTGLADPQAQAERIARMEAMANADADVEIAELTQQLTARLADADTISRQATAEGYAVDQIGRMREGAVTKVGDIRKLLTSDEIVEALRNTYNEAKDFLSAAGLSRQTRLKIGVKNVRDQFDRFGRKVGGEYDMTLKIGDRTVKDLIRRKWANYAETTTDKGYGFYRGGTKAALEGIDQVQLNLANAGINLNSYDEVFAELIKRWDIIDTLDPLMSPTNRRIVRRIYGQAGGVLDPQLLFGREYSGLSYEDLLEALKDPETLSAIQETRFNNAVNEFIEFSNDMDEFGGLQSDEITRIIGDAVSGRTPEALNQARLLQKEIEKIEEQLNIAAEKPRKLGLAEKGVNRAKLYDVAERFKRNIINGMMKVGLDEEQATQLMEAYYASVSDQSLYAVDELGRQTDFGLGKVLLPNGDGDLVPTGGVILSPGLRSEMLSRHIYLPDPRKVRRLQSKVGWITGVKKSNPERFGDLRAPAAMLEWLQQDIWRPMALMTGGYVLRNVAEAQARLTLLSKTSLFKHPAQHLMWAAGYKGATDVMGQAWEIAAPSRFMVRKLNRQEAASIDNLVRGSHEEYMSQMMNAYHRHGGDPTEALRGAIRSGHFDAAMRDGVNQTDYIQGFVDELRKLYDDPLANKVARGADEETLMRWLKTTEEGREQWAALDDYGMNGLVHFVNGTKTRVPHSMLDENNLRNYIRRSVIERLNQNALPVGALENNILRDVAAHGLIQTGDEVALTADEIKGMRKIFSQPGGEGIGNIIVLRTEARKVRGELGKVETAIYGKVISTDEAGISRVLVMEDAWDKNRKATPAFKTTMKRLLANQDTRQQLPAQMVYEVTISRGRLAGRRGRSAAAESAARGMDNMVDKFFGQLYGKTTAYLDRSVPFRQQYWEQVEQILPVVDGESVARMRAYVMDASERLKLSPERVVGSKSLWKKIETVPNTRPGRVSFEQLDDYARGWGLDWVKENLYNASDRNNLTDVMRVLAPFGQAWSEILQTWAKLVATDPRVLRRANLAVEGPKGADPDGDGRGFFYKDPLTGEYVFNYPMSDKAIGFITGPLSRVLDKVPLLNRFGSEGGQVSAMLTAPIKSLNMGFSVSPGIGPVAQIPAAIILRNIPNSDDVRNLLLPHGATQLRGSAFIPAWLQKFVSGVWDSPDTSRVMGQTYVEVVQHLYSTGKYDAADQNQRERMFEDAVGIARQLTVLRSFGQFIGPSRPTVEFEGVDFPAGFYAQELRKLQDPEQGGDYDTAVENFLDLYPEAVAYLGAKTKSKFGGLDITEEYGKWEEDNAQLFSRYKDVAGFFGPYDDAVAGGVWSRQLMQGKRTRQTAREVIDDAEFRAGNSRYQSVAKLIPSARTDEQRAALRQLRTLLGQKYPGFATLQSFDTRKFDRQIEQLRRAANDPDLADNPVRAAVASYLEVRDTALGVAISRGRSSLASPKDEDLRAIIRGSAQLLIQKYPDFSRMYDRVLAREVENDEETGGS